MPAPRNAQVGPNDEDACATKIQSAVRGFLARQNVRVTSLAPDIVHTRIQGHASTFERLGMGTVDTTHGERRLDIVALSSESFEGHVIGGDRRYQNLVVDAEENIHSFGTILAIKLPGDQPRAFINGGYYNSQGLADRTRPHHVPIGSTTKAGGQALESLPVPTRCAHRYATMAFDDGSRLTSGPVLSEKGVPQFVEEDLENLDFRFQDKVIHPGELNHAQHPNPRSLLSRPEASGPGNRYRLAVGANRFDKSRGGPMGPGFTMPEWAHVAARLDLMNTRPGGSVNLDGGATSTMGVVGGDMRSMLRIDGPTAPTVSTLIAFTRRTDVAS